jgi:preprotein translocase subunit SecA
LNADKDEDIADLIRQETEFEWEDIRDDLASEEKKIGRNDPCPCGSGKKYKKCHMGKELPV